ncbi:hypothetical protein AAFF_G00146720 [Aldrovandia affinis]|uniref:Uncharacterized protein n=1 Tax=Aldrovandia affinis TaxID=143900 RepID=A0AAD7RPN7_9TELE|nr:hypothetical protein AAFF_G00146720 [Aldrovandia affinis]
MSSRLCKNFKTFDVGPTRVFKHPALANLTLLPSTDRPPLGRDALRITAASASLLKASRFTGAVLCRGRNRLSVPPRALINRVKTRDATK